MRMPFFIGYDVDDDDELEDEIHSHTQRILLEDSFDWALFLTILVAQLSAGQVMENIIG